MIEKQVKISEIKRNPANPRVIRDDKYTKLLNSLLVFPKMLQARPIVVDKQMVVLGGNMRLKALQEIATFDNDELFSRLQKINEWKEKEQSEQTEIFDFWLDFATTKKLSVAVADDFTDKEASAFIIKDNNNFGDWDYDLLNNWDSELLEDWGVDVDFAIEEEEKESVEDEAPEEVETRCKLGDIWQLGEHRLICGDSTDVAVIDKLMDGVKAQLLLTDPPYGVKAVESGGHNDGKKAGKQICRDNVYMPVIGDDTTDTARANYDVALTCTENQIIFGGNYFTDFLPPSRCWIVWDKKVAGSFADGELAWTSFDRNLKIYEFMWSGMRRQGDRTVEGKTRVHPTQKPVGMLADILKDFSEENDSVLDCFGGSGSTLIACEQLNRKCYMCELDEHYCDIILQRWENLTNKKATKIK